MTSKNVHIHYFAVLREKRGLNEETLQTNAENPKELYSELQKRYNFNLSLDRLKVAINEEFSGWDTLLKSEDRVVFIPPVAGG